MRVLGDEFVFLDSVGAADGEGFHGDGHAVLEGESDVTDAVPHGVDLEELAVGGEALHLLLPETVVSEGDRASGAEESADEAVNGGGGIVKLLLLGAVHGFNANLFLQEIDELGTDGRAGSHGSDGRDLLHGGEADLGHALVGMHNERILAVGAHEAHHVVGVEMLETAGFRAVESAGLGHGVVVPGFSASLGGSVHDGEGGNARPVVNS